MLKRILMFIFAIFFVTGVAYAAAPAEVPKTGQTASQATGDDGDLEKGVAWPSPRFVVSADCVTDNLTGLMWAKTPESESKTWTSALAFADSLSLCNYSDWRLPNLNELESLVHAGKSDTAAWLNDQGFVSVDSTPYYWTSTTYAGSGDPACGGSVCAWYVNMPDGYLGFAVKEDTGFTGFAWAVRSGQ